MFGAGPILVLAYLQLQYVMFSFYGGCPRIPVSDKMAALERSLGMGYVDFVKI